MLVENSGFGAGGIMDVIGTVMKGAELLSTIVKDDDKKDNATVQIIERQAPPTPVISNPDNSRPIVFNLTINVYKDGELVTSGSGGDGTVIDLK